MVSPTSRPHDDSRGLPHLLTAASYVSCEPLPNMFAYIEAHGCQNLWRHAFVHGGEPFATKQVHIKHYGLELGGANFW